MTYNSGADHPSLRDYQTDVFTRVLDAIDTAARGILLVAPTGAGKTVLAAALIKDALHKEKRVLFLAHRRELIKQASNKLYGADIDHGILLPGYGPRPEEPVQVASIATLYARAFQSRRMYRPEATW